MRPSFSDDIPAAAPSAWRALPIVRGVPAFEPEHAELARADAALDLSSNENLLGPSPRAMEALAEARGRQALYPDPGARALTRALARGWEVPDEAVRVGAGAVGFLDVISRVFLGPERELVAPAPSFEIYPRMAAISGARLVQVPLDDGVVDLDGIAAAVTPRTRVVVVCHPNNPTSTLAPDLEGFLEGLPEQVVAVVDEAYAEFAGLGSPGRLLRLPLRCGLLVLRTFSKLHGLAGLRVGAAVGTAAELDAVARGAPPYWTSDLAQVAARAALEDHAHVRASLAAVHAGLQVARQRAGLLGWRLLDARASFFCLQVPGDDLGWAARLRQRGVLVAAGAPLGLPGWIRVGAGGAEAVGRCFDALEADP